LIYGPKIKIYNTKNKLQATDFTPAESNLAKDSDSKVTAKSYCPDPVRVFAVLYGLVVAMFLLVFHIIDPVKMLKHFVHV
jgi:hypothetical protein